MMKVADLFQDVRDEMSDDGTRYPEEVLLRFINMATREIVRLVPLAGSTFTQHQLVEGVNQQIPELAATLIDVVCNVGGITISRTSSEELDSYNPTWRQAAPVAEVLEFVYTPSVHPRSFLVSPPQPAAPALVEIIVSIFPDPVTDSAVDDFPLPMEYVNAAIAFMCHKAHKGETGEGSQKDAQGSYATFLMSLGVKQ